MRGRHHGDLHAAATGHDRRAQRVSYQKPGALEVRFAPQWLSWVPWTWADYWVIDLDPSYRWAVVGSPSRDYLWILSRTPTMDSAQFEQLKRKAEAKGYDLRDLQVMTTLSPAGSVSR